MRTPRWSWSSNVAVVLACALWAVGCGGSSRSSSGGGGTGTTTPGQVGSNYWYVNDTHGNPLKTHDATEATLAQEVLILLNQERAANGRAALSADASATQAAKAHVEDMRGRSYFAHNSPEGWTPLTRLQLLGATGFSRVGENIAMGQPTPTAVMNAWMNSAGHRANILDPAYTHVGIGVVRTPGPYWAQVFLTRP
ncbi:MAG: hypothetical protein KIT58_11275 [Planctomycetota bacterium]|nr:hypothetical protein [Planctomycetota bacterium]